MEQFRPKTFLIVKSSLSITPSPLMSLPPTPRVAPSPLLSIARYCFGMRGKLSSTSYRYWFVTSLKAFTTTLIAIAGLRQHFALSGGRGRVLSTWSLNRLCVLGSNGEQCYSDSVRAFPNTIAWLSTTTTPVHIVTGIGVIQLLERSGATICELQLDVRGEPLCLEWDADGEVKIICPHTACHVPTLLRRLRGHLPDSCNTHCVMRRRLRPSSPALAGLRCLTRRPERSLTLTRASRT